MGKRWFYSLVIVIGISLFATSYSQASVRVDLPDGRQNLIERYGVFNANILDADSALPVDVNKTKLVWFKGKTEYFARKNGTIAAGVLLKDLNEKSNNLELVFQGGKQISFFDDGYVHTGWLQGSTEIMRDVNGKLPLIIKGGSFIVLRPDGSVKFGTLQQDANLPIDKKQSKFALFKAGTEVLLRDDGSVTVGTLAKDSLLQYICGKELEGTIKAGSEVAFNNDGSVVLGFIDVACNAQNETIKILDSDTEYYVDTSHSKHVGFKEGTLVYLRQDGSIRKGSLQREQKLQFICGGEKMELLFKAGEELEFFDDGSVIKGFLDIGGNCDAP